MWPCGCMAPPIRPKVATGLPSLVMKAGMMVWNGRFFGPTWLAMARGRHEARGAVLQRDAGARHDDARAEAGVVRLDQRHHHARGVGGAEIDRAAVLGRARAEILGLLRIDQLGAALEIVLVEHLRRRHFHEARIGDVAPDVGEGELHRLDAEMRHLRPVAIVAGEVEILEDAERHAGGDALTRRRDLVQGRAAIGEADGIDPVGACARRGPPCAARRRSPWRTCPSPRRARRDRRPRPWSRRSSPASWPGREISTARPAWARGRRAGRPCTQLSWPFSRSMARSHWRAIM